MKIESKNILEITRPYIEFSKKIIESDENLQKISKRMREVDDSYIKEYFNHFFRIRKEQYKNIAPFFRILTLNTILSSNNDEYSFNSISGFINYVEDFKDRLRSDHFPENFLEEIENVKDLGPIFLEEEEFYFNMEFVKKFVKPDIEKIDSQFQNYGDFRFFRYFMMYYTPEGIELKDSFPQMWNLVFEIIVEILELDPEEYFEDHSRFFMSKGTYESDNTWGCLIKKNVGELEIQDHRTRSIQLYININANGLTVGTYLGTKSNDLLNGFIESNVNDNKEILINLFRGLKTKYKSFIKILDDNDQEIEFEQSLDDEILRENLFDSFKTRYSISFYTFMGDQALFDNIIKDIYSIYQILAGEKLDFPPKKITPISKFIEKNFKKINLLEAKNEIISKLNFIIGVDLNKIIEKALRLLQSNKNIILYGAPGTGKTLILERIFGILKKKYGFIDDVLSTTATSDWTIFETIGGLIPRQPKLDFRPGLFLRCFKKDKNLYNCWLLIDELNRANIDKTFGYFFSLLSDQEVELPFSTYEGKTVKVIPLKKYLNNNLTKEQITKIIETDSPKFEYYYIPPTWRIGGTINSSDKASLHQLSHAFIRRFGFIKIPIPNINDFIQNYSFQSNKKEMLKKIWINVNEVFEIGPSIIIDMDNLLKSPELDIFDAFEAFILPQIENLPDDMLNTLMEKLKVEFGGDQADGKHFDQYKIKY